MDSAPPVATPNDLKAQLRALSRPSDLRGLLHLGGHLLLLAATGAAVLLTLGSWLLPIALLAHGVALIFLFAPLHEIVHRTAFRTRGLNDAVARACGFLLVLPADYFRAFHLEHHRFTQDPARDPELAGPPLAGRWRWLLHVSGLPYWQERFASTCRHALGTVSETYVSQRLKPAIVREARAHLALYAAALAVSFAATSPLLLWLWILPALLGQPFLRLYLLAEHSGCPRVPDMLANSRTTLTVAPLRALCWNMNLHSAHHAWPGVPFHALPAADRLLAPQVAVRDRGYFAVNREIWRRLGTAPAS